MVPLTDNSNGLPCIRDNLTIRAVSETEYVVKRNDNREYFSMGPQEVCLLTLLDGRHTVEQIQSTYRDRFHEELSESDLQEFIDAVRPLGLFRYSSSTLRTQTDGTLTQVADVASHSQSNGNSLSTSTASFGASGQRKNRSFLHGQSILFFRIPLGDPDQALGRLVRLVPFVWTKGFVVISGLIMALAFCVMTSNRLELATGIQSSKHWTDAALFMIVMIGCTTLHEIAHGATLKFYGGEVHDNGVLFMFFTPCMYCNASDAWLIPDKWKRMAITAAGGFCDMCVWALAVFLWRLTVPATWIHSVSFMAMTICGGRSLLNFNPLIKLDGYYLLSDWLSIPNLRQRGTEYWMGHVRWLLWGAAKPLRIPEARSLLIYGFCCWCFAFVFLDLIFIQFFEYMGGQFGLTGLLFVALMLSFALRRVFQGFFASEFGIMLKSRPGRTAIWAVGSLAAITLLFFVPVRSTTSGDFEVRPGNVVQIHVPVSGIIQQVFVEDGSPVDEGQLIAELKSPSLDSDIAKTEDLVREVEANYQRLTAGPRREELTAAEDRVQRLTEWYDLGTEELKQAQIAHTQELLVQNHRIEEARAELNNANENLKHSENLYRQRALAGAQLRQERLLVMQMESRLAQAEATLNALKANGVRAKEAEIARRTQELEDARDRLKLLQAGTRPEELAAEAARKERVKHELAYLESQREKLKLRATTSGIFSSPRLKERVGQAVPQDSLFCTIEMPETSRVEISVSEDEATLLKAGQAVTLKARAIPFETFEAKVEGISATALRTPTVGHNVVVVHCQIENPDGRLKSGMTGFGRISRGWNSIGMLLLTKGIRYLRTEFWW